MLALSCGDCLGNIPHRESIAEFVRFSNNDDVFDLAALITVTSPIYELHLKNLETINATGCSFFFANVLHQIHEISMQEFAIVFTSSSYI